MTEQSINYLKSHLQQQIYFLKSSAKAYDEGYIIEAKRIATSIRILVHDTKKSKSLLMLLKKKDIKFYDTALKPRPGNLLPTTGLVFFQIQSGKTTYFPRLDNTHMHSCKVDFDQWWEGIIVIDKNRTQFNRSELILKMCNQDGGAHVDLKLNDKYAALSRSNSLGWKLESSEGEEDLMGIELASIRQICHEILKSLRDEFPEYF
ncbi:MAG: hypothetical protein ACPK85_06350 [Methanosarcina sp.]